MWRVPYRHRETFLAYAMLLPPILIVAAIVLFPVTANFWISFKSIELADLQAPKPVVRDRIRLDAAAGRVAIRYRLRNSSARGPVTGVTLTHTLPAGFRPLEAPAACQFSGRALRCDLGDWPAGYRGEINALFAAPPAFFASGVDLRKLDPVIEGASVNALLAPKFTLDNYRRVFAQREFWNSLRITTIYTIMGTIGALLLGLFAALLLNRDFRFRGIIRGMFLFPFVSPVISVAFTWVFLLDPFNGVVNALLAHYGVSDGTINFLGARTVPIEILGYVIKFPLALSTVIAFEAWRYFPLSFLFIAARMQALPSDLYEAADIDGASPLQKFRYITLPQLVGILSILFMLRFIWTFNKFDDIFLLTGGAAGTRTLTVGVYDEAFALANLGAGAAFSVVIFLVLAIFMVLYFTFFPKGESL